MDWFLGIPGRSMQMKQDMILVLTRKLTEMGIPFLEKDVADISVFVYVLEQTNSGDAVLAGYEIELLLDENSKVAYLYVEKMTTLIEKKSSTSLSECKMTIGAIVLELEEKLEKYHWKINNTKNKADAVYKKEEKDHSTKITERIGENASVENNGENKENTDVFIEKKRINIGFVGIVSVMLLFLFFSLYMVAVDSDFIKQKDSISENKTIKSMYDSNFLDLEEQIRADAQEQIYTYNGCDIKIPGDFLTDKTYLSISQVDGVPPPFLEAEKLSNAWEVKVGELKEFDKEIIIEMPYDPEKVKGIPIEHAFLPVYYNTFYKCWMDLPYTVDKSQNKIAIKLKHASTIQCFYSVWKGAKVYHDGNVTVIYSSTTNLNPLFLNYEAVVGLKSKTKNTPLFVLDVVKKAKEIMRVYAENNLIQPIESKIFCTKGSVTNYGWSDSLVLKLNVANQIQADKVLTSELAYKYFCAAGRSAIGDQVFRENSKTEVAFWLEATAYYMANTGFWKLVNEDYNAINNYSFYGPDFFEGSLFLVGNNHEKEAANFIEFLQKEKEATPLQLVSIASKNQDFEKAFAAVYGEKSQKENLSLYYQKYLEYSLFDMNSKLKVNTNERLESLFASSKEIYFDTEDLTKSETAKKMGSASMSSLGSYSASFYRFVTNQEVLLTINPNTNLSVFLMSRIQNSRGYLNRIIAYKNSSTQIRFGKDEFVLVVYLPENRDSAVFIYQVEPITGDNNLQITP